MPGSATTDDSDYELDKSFEDLRRPKEKEFICGVVEGFYGRPWNTHQRIELFARMKKLGMNTYLYAPKDDVKHRAYWRDLYTVEEADSLTELIQSAKKQDIKFVYAISPGLDMTYSSVKDLTILRRKLDQVSSFGCDSFALLFDDILPEMNKCDKEVFASFAHAQSSVTNQIYEHLKQPSFLFCPTEYCASRSIPTVSDSQYLNTIGEKLIQGIEIMWTGPKVVSKIISVSSIKELAKVLRRPPLIWDNIHANDYDQKRIYLGPYDGRCPSLIPFLSGVLTNPNCEFEPNFIALHTLASWSKSEYQDIKRQNSVETHVERENLSKLEDNSVVIPGYDLMVAHKLAIKAWLPTFYTPTQPDGGRPPPPKLALAPTDDTPIVDAIITPILNNIPTSVMTCMAVTPITQTAPVGLAVPVNQLVGTVTVPSEPDNSQETDSVASPAGEPMDVITDKPSLAATGEPAVKELLPNSLISTAIPAASSEEVMQVDEEVTSSADLLSENEKLNIDDLAVICDMFYLPFEHGSKAQYVLSEFQWLKINSHVMDHTKLSTSPELHLVEEWKQRAEEFDKFVKYFAAVCKKFQMIPNSCLMYDLNDYIWDLRGTLSLLNSYIKWLGLARVMTEVDCEILDCRITWSTKGYNDAFLSGDNEPWVFRGGLTGELQRLLPISNSTDLFSIPQRSAELENFPPKVYTIRPYIPSDETAVYNVCKAVNHSMVDLKDSTEQYDHLIPDLLIGGLVTLSSQFSFVVENDDGVCGYILATPDANDFHRKMSVSWLPEMQKKYPLPVETDNTSLTKAQGLVSQFHNYQPEKSELLLTQYPALVKMEFLPSVKDLSIKQRTLACMLSALQSVQVVGVHCLSGSPESRSYEMYNQLGFVRTNPNVLTPENDDTLILVRII